ncbi:hypothetical protein NBO_60g0019 [Nosema bombycis CQ1]|uniref:Uncharacterized protein n=1 Tax=Nosema bombycis (strain CQ1 / CVCC 102059) TaxID=578461 RepID=R0MLQ1_NOSB1|nr:hypothetical protein NBO_60g0019 [Nosema bombycis CQ1]|eukprot:EOB13763.1 hypothetical protein NBO_60g0019 [Nosema bombycis CQ1]
MKIANFFILTRLITTTRNRSENLKLINSFLENKSSVNAMCFCDINSLSDLQSTPENIYSSRGSICYDHDNQKCLSYLKNVLNIVFNKKIIKNCEGSESLYSKKKKIYIFEGDKFSILFFPFKVSQKRYSRLLIFVVLKDKNWNLHDLWKYFCDTNSTNLIQFYHQSDLMYVDVNIPIPNLINLTNKFEITKDEPLISELNLQDELITENENFWFIWKKRLSNFFKPAQLSLKVYNPYIVFVCNESDGKILIMFKGYNKF